MKKVRVLLGMAAVLFLALLFTPKQALAANGEITIYYWYCSGEDEWESVEKNIKPNGRTYREVFEEGAQGIKHYKPLGNFTWDYLDCGEDFLDSKAEITGDDEYYFDAIYENDFVFVNIEYIDEDGCYEYTCPENALVYPKDAKIQEVVDNEEVSGILNSLEHREGFKGWVYSEDLNDPVSSIQDNVLDIVAEYDGYDIDLELYYIDENGETQKVEAVFENVPSGTNAYDLYNEALNKELGVSGKTYNWCIMSDTDNNVIGPMSYFCGTAAVQYEGKTPVYISRDCVVEDEEGYTDNYISGVYYIDGAPAMIENEYDEYDETSLGDSFEKNLMEAVEAENSAPPEFNLKDFYYNYCYFYEPEGYGLLVECYVVELYDKSLIIIEYYNENDGYIKETLVCPTNSEGEVEYTMPEKGSSDIGWDVNGPIYGYYDYFYDGEKVTFKEPYVYVSKWEESEVDNPFTDIPDESWYTDAVLWAYGNGITTGMSATQFAPDATCTRGQVVTFIHRGEGEPEPESDYNPFTDVKKTDYFYNPVLWAVENEVTSGMSTTTFGPHLNCTRAQVITFLWRAAGKPQPSESAAFKDVPANAYYAEAVAWGAEEGIVNGISDDKFGPDQTCTRAQVVTFMYRYSDYISY